MDIVPVCAAYKKMSYFQELTSIENLMESFGRVRKSSGWKESVQRYEINLLTNLEKLRKEVLNGSYQPKPGNSFVLTERGRKRLIQTFSIDDMILQHTLCDKVLTPTVRPYLIHDNGASLKGKGISFTRRRFEQHLHDFYRQYGTDGYALKIDFYKFFDNIQHEKLLTAYAEYIREPQILELLRCILQVYEIDVLYSDNPCIENMPFNSLEYMKVDKKLLTGKHWMRKSLGIGSPIAQISGVFFAHELDTYCKTVRRVKFYDVYMDDRIILYHDKEYLRKLLKDIERITNNLGLFLNKKKTQIIKLSHGFTFLKTRYYLTSTGRIIRKIPPDVIIRQRRKMKKMAYLAKDNEISLEKFKEQYESWRGDKKRYNAYHTLRNMDLLYKELLLWITKK